MEAMQCANCGDVFYSSVYGTVCSEKCGDGYIAYLESEAKEYEQWKIEVESGK